MASAGAANDPMEVDPSSGAPTRRRGRNDDDEEDDDRRRRRRPDPPRSKLKRTDKDEAEPRQHKKGRDREPEAAAPARPKNARQREPGAQPVSAAPGAPRVRVHRPRVREVEEGVESSGKRVITTRKGDKKRLQGSQREESRGKQTDSTERKPIKRFLELAFFPLRVVNQDDDANEFGDEARAVMASETFKNRPKEVDREKGMTENDIKKMSDEQQIELLMDRMQKLTVQKHKHPQKKEDTTQSLAASFLDLFRNQQAVYSQGAGMETRYSRMLFVVQLILLDWDIPWTLEELLVRLAVLLPSEAEDLQELIAEAREGALGRLYKLGFKYTFHEPRVLTARRITQLCEMDENRVVAAKYATPGNANPVPRILSILDVRGYWTSFRNELHQQLLQEALQNLKQPIRMNVKGTAEEVADFFESQDTYLRDLDGPYRYRLFHSLRYLRIDYKKTLKLAYVDMPPDERDTRPGPLTHMLLTDAVLLTRHVLIAHRHHPRELGPEYNTILRFIEGSLAPISVSNPSRSPHSKEADTFYRTCIIPPILKSANRADD